MANFTKQIISLIQQAQERQAQALELTYDSTIKHAKVSELTKADYSNRKLVESQLKVIIDSLVEYGFLGAIYVNGDTNEVVDGWHRLELWKQLGHDTIPAYILQFQNRKHECEAHLRLNSVLAVFNPEDFGIHFANIDPLEFGITETEVKTYDSAKALESTKANKAPEMEGYKRLTTTIKSESFLKLQSFKKSMNVAHVADVVERLIEYYECH